MSPKFLDQLSKGIPLEPLPPPGTRNPNVPHAPVRKVPLTPNEHEIAINNALRYFPIKYHELLRAEFKEELQNYGHIYMYRFTPQFSIKAYPIEDYPAKTLEARAIMLMISNNLDAAVAQFPQELVTYGGNGQTLSNWAQFWLVMKYLCEMDETQVLVMYSGHPMGLFPARPGGPRVVITNGMMVPNYSNPGDYDKYFSMGVTMYGQMTAGSYCYIGPQGIVHGTTITLLNAGRKYLNSSSLKGKVYVTSGLGGMSGAQAKAAVIAGCVGVIAEVSLAALKKRHEQGWLQEVAKDLDSLIERIKEAKINGEVTSIGYHGNIVDLWERLAQEYEKTQQKLVDLGSDQTSLHDPYNGGYYPVSLTYDESQKLMVSDPPKFKYYVQLSLRRQIVAINTLVEKTGMKFWDYGNAFLLEAKRAGAPVEHPDDTSRFIYPSYVEDIMGDIFSLGFGPFRWVCCSGLPEDLEKTDQAAADVFLELLQDKELDPDVNVQYQENLKWVQEAGRHNLVVGSQARILYNDCAGRSKLATRFNELIKSGELKGPVVLSRDHHDVSGADSPFRETSNVTDGSKFTADMAVQNFIGDGIRGATWVAIHNGGGVGWGEVMNGGFGLVLNGENSATAQSLLLWDVNNGIARRAWAGNKFAVKAIRKEMERTPGLKVTLPP
ncbi:urocanate hydratase [Folsomia candida]|uniref:urocanate hydratase n=1 Tax=Folsomia candida TaxID=158441 RepID=UPI000B905051|nr:urocanate hydratase [Folsomia candida]